MDWNDKNRENVNNDSQKIEKSKRVLRPSEKKKLANNNRNRETENPKSNTQEKSAKSMQEKESQLTKNKKWKSKIGKIKTSKLSFKAPKRELLKLIFVLLPFILLFLLGIYLLSPLHHIDDIAVDKNQEVQKTDIIEVSGINKKMTRSFLKTNRARIENNIVKQLPLIKTSTVQFTSWNDIKIVVEEYRELGYIQEADFYYPLLENKAVVKEGLSQMPDSKPLLVGFSEMQLGILAEQLSSASDDVIANIQMVELKSSDNNDEQVVLKMRDGNLVIATLSTLGSHIKYYENVAAQLEDKTGLIDMQVGIFYQELTPADNPYATAEEKKNYEKEVTATSESLEQSSEASSSSDVQSSGENETQAEDEQSEQSESTESSSSISNASEE